jgi:hypothetical protein
MAAPNPYRILLIVHQPFPLRSQAAVLISSGYYPFWVSVGTAAGAGTL